MSFFTAGSTHRNFNILLGSLAGAAPANCTDAPVWSLIAGLPAAYIYTLNAVAYGGGNFVAVGNNAGQPGVLYSADGLTWNVATTAATGAGAFNPAFGNDVFVAGSNAIRVIRSTDFGVNWSAIAVALGGYLNISFANGKFYMVQNAGIGRSVDDGLTFSAAVYTGISSMNSNVCGNGARMIVAGHDGIGVGFTIISDDDGLTWNPSAVVPPWNNTTCPQRIVYNATLNLFVAVGSSSANTDQAYYSSDGENWSVSAMVGTAAGTNRWRDVVFANGLFVAVSSLTTDVDYSDDGINWNLSANAMIAGGAAGLAAGSGHIYVAQRDPGGAINDIRRGVC